MSRSTRCAVPCICSTLIFTLSLCFNATDKRNQPRLTASPGFRRGLWCVGVWAAGHSTPEVSRAVQADLEKEEARSTDLAASLRSQEERGAALQQELTAEERRTAGLQAGLSDEKARSAALESDLAQTNAAAAKLEVRAALCPLHASQA